MKRILVVLVAILAMGGCGKKKPAEVKGMEYYKAHPEEIKPLILKCREMTKRGEMPEQDCYNAEAAASTLISNGKFGNIGKNLKQPGVTLTEENARLAEEIHKENQRLRKEYSF